MKKFLCCFILTFFAGQSWAYNERGNSGFAIICNDPAENKFYDSFEADYRYGLKPNYPTAESSCSDDRSCLRKAVVLARLMMTRTPLEKNFKTYISTRLKSFIDEAKFLEGIEILPVNDMGIGFIPRDCKLVQTIVQRIPIFPHDSRYIISKDYWDKLSIMEQTAGVIHEILYGYYGELKIEPKSSEKIRYLNALILSDEISKMDAAKFQSLLNQVYSVE